MKSLTLPVIFTTGLMIYSSYSPPGLNLPERKGIAPETTHTMPHSQLDQNSSPAMHELLAAWMFTALSAVEEKPSGVSVKGARALSVKPGVHIKNQEAIMIKREFAHLHPLPDGSLHASLSLHDAGEVLDTGWGEYHPLVLTGAAPGNLVMVYGPRDEEELEIVKRIVKASYYFATGLLK